MKLLYKVLMVILLISSVDGLLASTQNCLAESHQISKAHAVAITKHSQSELYTSHPPQIASSTSSSGTDKIRTNLYKTQDGADTSRTTAMLTDSYKLTANQLNPVVNNTIQVTIMAKKIIKTPIAIPFDAQQAVLNVQATCKLNPQYTFKLENNMLTITPQQQNNTDQVVLVIKLIQTGQLTLQLNRPHMSSNRLCITTTENQTPKVLAVNPEEFDDGITNWQKVTTAPEATYAITKDLSLDFTFGTINGGSQFPDVGNPSPIYLQPNVYLVDNGTGADVWALFCNNSNYATDSSDSFGIVTDKAANPSDQNWRAQAPNINGEGLESDTYKENAPDANVDPTLFVGTDSQGRMAIKKVVDNVKNKYQFEILYRFSTNGAPIVQQELYLKNTATTDLNYGAYLSLDTDLNENDNIPLFSQGSSTGIYMQDPNYKILMNMQVPDGPTDYAATLWRDPGKIDATHVFDSFVPKNITGQGRSFMNPNHPVKATPNGEQLFPGKDSAYTARWDWHALKPGGVDHYRQDIGVTKQPYVVPYARKSYVNSTSTDHKNRVGDTVQFKLTAKNQGYKTSWGKVKFTDTIPTAFQIDANTIKLINADGSTVKVPASAYDPTTHQLNVGVNQAIADNQSVAVTFAAKILPVASGKTIRNTFTATGVDDNDNGTVKTATAFVDVPVESVPYSGHLDKLVKNETQKEPDYQQATTGKYGDIVDYQIKYGVDQDSTTTLATGELKDELPQELVLKKGSIKVTYDDGSSESPSDTNDIQLKPLGKGNSVTVTFEAQITQQEAGMIKNTAHFSGTTSANVQAPSSESEADIKVAKSEQGKVIFRYIDRKSNMKNPAQIADTVTVSGPIGKKVSAINAEPMRPKHIKGWTVIDATQTADLTNATFFQAEKLNPIIAKQDQVITYRYEKAMISLSAPETWNFGKYLNTQRDAIYYLPATRNTANQKVPSGVNVEDYFGTDSWTLSVQQTGQFKSQADPNSHDPALRHAHELTGAQLQFNNALLKKIAAHEASTAKDVVNNLSHFTLEPAAKQSTTVVTYSKKGHFDQHVATDSDGQKYDDPGWNVWRYQFGRQQQADYSVGLHVPATTKRYKTHYQADLTWTLAIAP